MSRDEPFYDEVQAHYDLSDDFFALFLDPTRTYSCAYFERDDMTLQEAQLAKIDLALGKCDLRPRQRLLDIGCGWGATMRRAVEKFDVRVVGLTLSRNQFEYVQEQLADLGERAEVRLQGWEQFDEPVDRIVSIGAMEHFKEKRYAAFFEKCHRLLPEGSRMLLHSIVWPEREYFERPGNELTHEDVQFVKFIGRTIFPGGQLRAPSIIRRYAEAAGFRIEREHSLQPHYAKTLDLWAARLEAARDRALELVSREVYDTYMRYLTGCANYFHRGYTDVVQFTLCKES